MVSGPPLSKRRGREGREGRREPSPDCGDDIPMSKKGEAAEGEAEYHYVSPGECPSVLKMLNSYKLLQNSIWLGMPGGFSH